MRLRISFASLTSIAVLSFATTRAEAQIHYDVGAEAGVMKRALSSTNAGASDPSFGPAATLHAHFALFPMLRAGVYASHDVSPLAGERPRQFWSGGLEARVLPPFIRGEHHFTWIALGAGFASVYAPSYTASIIDAQSGQTKAAYFGGDSGTFLEIPVSVGYAYRLSKTWALTAELGARFGLLMGGDVYDGRAAAVTGLPTVVANPDGNDTFALSLMVGVELDQ